MNIDAGEIKMKKSTVVEIYEKDLITLIEHLKLVIPQKNLQMTERVLEDINEMMKLYKNALDNKLSNSKEQTDIQEDSGLDEKDFTGSLGSFS